MLGAISYANRSAESPNLTEVTFERADLIERGVTLGEYIERRNLSPPPVRPGRSASGHDVFYETPSPAIDYLEEMGLPLTDRQQRAVRGAVLSYTINLGDLDPRVARLSWALITIQDGRPRERWGGSAWPPVRLGTEDKRALGEAWIPCPTTGSHFVRLELDAIPYGQVAGADTARFNSEVNCRDVDGND